MIYNLANLMKHCSWNKLFKFVLFVSQRSFKTGFFFLLSPLLPPQHYVHIKRCVKVAMINVLMVLYFHV